MDIIPIISGASFCRYYEEALWTPYGEVFDIGNTTVEAILHMKHGIPPIKAGGDQDRDNGNGSLMRILPLAFYLKNIDAAQRIQIIEEVSSITHRHPRSLFACVFYVEFAINLMRYRDKQTAYAKTMEFVREHCNALYSSELPYYAPLLNGNIANMEKQRIKSSGYVVTSLITSIWRFMTTDHFEESIFNVINLGSDTDTIAAITGGLSGIFYGIEAIPIRWIQSLARKQDIHDLIVAFATRKESI